MQTEEPYWLQESYSEAIADYDIGSMNRALQGSRVVENLVLTTFDQHGKYIDWGGGYGVFTRIMRDKGYDFYWKDIYCENIFAKHFSYECGQRYELLTAFEVFEHLLDPVTEIEEMLSYSRNLFFTTLLIPANLSRDWWYLAPETGQHIAFYTPAALTVIAKRLGLQFLSDGVGNHLLSERRISPRLFRLMVADGRIAGLARRMLRRKLRKSSLLEQDFEQVSGLKIGAGDTISESRRLL